MNRVILITVLVFTLTNCESQKSINPRTKAVYVTSEAGDKMAEKEVFQFTAGRAENGSVIKIFPSLTKQTIDGIGSSFTESSAFVLAHLDKEKRNQVMEEVFGENGANFSLARTHIGACDFSVKGRYSYADEPGDDELSNFDISPDMEGFNPEVYPGIKEPSYDLLPMIKEALAVKEKQHEKDLRIVSSAWTAPAWMKDINDWFIQGAPENNYQGTGGSLKPEYEGAYADYLIKYIEAYAKEGVKIWGITPVNEPHGNNGQWESMHFSPETQNSFIKNYLGPKLANAGLADLNLLIFDQNRDGLEHWTDVILNDKETAEYIYGSAVHWYESTEKVYEDVFEKVHEKFPDFAIMHTEGCIDDLGKEPPDGVTDPERRKEKDWFDNDSFWWNDNATDWAYAVTWAGVNTDDHPIYTPVHRYARNIIVSLDHWVTGWIDWNIVLDKNGGPNHVGNFCGAPIMIDTETQMVYFTPVYYVLKQLSSTIRPGDKAVKTKRILGELGADDLHACATVNDDNLLTVQLLNTTKQTLEFSLEIEGHIAIVSMDANSIKTIRVQL